MAISTANVLKEGMLHEVILYHVLNVYAYIMLIPHFIIEVCIEHANWLCNYAYVNFLNSISYINLWCFVSKIL